MKLADRNIKWISNSLQEALVNLKKSIYNAIITELNLSDSKGVETLSSIYTLAFESSIIILTDNISSETELELITYGADDFLPIEKVDIISLTKSLRYAVERTQNRRRLSLEKSNMLRLIEKSKDAIIVTDESERILFYNQASVKMFKSENLIYEKFTMPYSYDKNIEYEYHNGEKTIYTEINAVKIEWNDSPAIFVNIRDISKRKSAEKESTKNTEILKSIFDNMPTGLILADYSTSEVLDVNPVCEDIIGYGKDEMLGKKYFSYLCNRRNNLRICPDENSRKIIKLETRIIDKNRCEIPVFLTSLLIEIDALKYILINIKDISEQKNYESHLEKNLMYERFITKITSMLFQYEGNGAVYERLLYELGKLTGSDHILLTSFDENNGKFEFEWWKKRNKDNSSIIFEKEKIKEELKVSDSIMVDHDISKMKYMKSHDINLKSSVIFAIFYENKQFGFLSLDSINSYKEFDVPEFDLLKTIARIISIGLTRIFHIEKIKDNYSLMNIMIHTIPEPVFYKDINGRYLGCNEIFAKKIFGISEEEIIGRSIMELKDSITGLPETEMKRIDSNDIELVKDNKSLVQEITMMNIDGIFRDYISYKAAFKDHKGEPAGLIGVMIDITDKNRKESEKNEMNRLLIESEKLSEIGQLSAGIAHEFNNILAIIKSSVQLMNLKNTLKKISLPDEVTIELNSIEENVNKASDIVSNLMNLSKPMETNKSPYSITSIIDEVLKMQKRQFEIENILIEKDYEDVPKILIDRGQMYQVFLNLSINARHAMKKKGRGTINVKIRKNDKFLEIIFKDTGCGIKEEFKNKIFQPFFSTKGAHSKESTEIKGTGLGLSVTKNIINSHGGSIEVESEEENGAEDACHGRICCTRKTEKRSRKRNDTFYISNKQYRA
jgi:PAS domain S-box-containing protein